MKDAAYLGVVVLMWAVGLVAMGLAARIMWFLLQIGWNVL